MGDEKNNKFHAKIIRIWKNGDTYSTGQSFLCNPMKSKTWNRVLESITQYLQPDFGAVCHLIEMDTHKSVHRFSDLTAEAKYVAVGKNRDSYKKDGYLVNNKSETKIKHYKSEAQLKAEKVLVATKKRRLIVIYVLMNGVAGPPTKFVLTRNDLMQQTVTMGYMANKLDVPQGIECLSTIHGTILCDLYELQHGFVYVALPFGENYKKMNYMEVYNNHLPARKRKFRLNLETSPELTKSSIHRNYAACPRLDQLIRKKCGCGRYAMICKNVSCCANALSDGPNMVPKDAAKVVCICDMDTQTSQPELKKDHCVILQRSMASASTETGHAVPKLVLNTKSSFSDAI